MQRTSLQLPHDIRLEDLPEQLALGAAFGIPGKKAKYVLQRAPPLDASFFEKESLHEITQHFILQESME